MHTDIRRKRIAILAGMAGALLILCLLWWARGPLTGWVALPTDDAASRLAFAARWLLLPATALLAGITAMALRRFVVDDAMDGARLATSWGMEVNLRYNQNTLEQLVLVAVAMVALAVSLDPARLALVPLLAMAFVLGRLLFWAGYRLHPLARGCGMAITFAPTLAAYGWLLAERALRLF